MTQRVRAEGNTKVRDSQVGTNAGASATLAATAGMKNIVTHISGSGDAACIVTIESPSGTVKWRKRFAAAFSFSENFSYGEIEAATGDAAVAKISASTSNCEVNIAGVQASAG